MFTTRSLNMGYWNSYRPFINMRLQGTTHREIIVKTSNNFTTNQSKPKFQKQVFAQRSQHSGLQNIYPER